MVVFLGQYPEVHHLGRAVWGICGACCRSSGWWWSCGAQCTAHVFAGAVSWQHCDVWGTVHSSAAQLQQLRCRCWAVLQQSWGNTAEGVLGTRISLDVAPCVGLDTGASLEAPGCYVAADKRNRSGADAPAPQLPDAHLSPAGFLSPGAGWFARTRGSALLLSLGYGKGFMKDGLCTLTASLARKGRHHLQPMQ